MATRTLPQVIGPTENALRTLLLTLVKESPIRSYEAWVALNLLDRPDSREIAAEIAKHLGVSRNEVAAVLLELGREGLVEPQSSGPELTPAGVEVLSTVRSRVGEANRRVMAGVDPDELEAAISTLDRIRVAVEREIAGQKVAEPEFGESDAAQ